MVNLYGEQRAAAWRLANRVAEYFTSLTDPERLAKWGWPAFKVHHEERRRKSKCEWGQDGRATLFLPRWQSIVDRNNDILHELGHCAMETWLAQILAETNSAELARLKQECAACYFEAAYRLPPKLWDICQGNATIAIRTRLSMEVVRRREAMLRAAGMLGWELTELPHWSAAADWTLLGDPFPEPGFRLLDDSGRPLYWFPASETPRDRELRIKADLLAFTPDEFGWKYRRYAVRERESDLLVSQDAQILPVTVAELRRDWVIDLRLSEVPSVRELRRRGFPYKPRYSID